MPPMPCTRTLAIDFGTSNSAVGAMVDGEPRLVEVEPGQDTIPTSIFFDFSSRETLFGTLANRALIEGQEGRFMRSLKSVLGTSLMHEKRWIMGREMSFVDIIGDFLSALKSRAETAFDQEFDTALSGRPVHFHSGDPTRDEQAYRDLCQCYGRAGFQSVSFMPEPEAAARAYGVSDQADQIGMIVDIGGGTSDFTLFSNRAEQMEVLASHGVRVGGTDFDRALSIAHVMPLFGRGAPIGRDMGPGTVGAPNWIFNDLATWQKIPFLYTGKTRAEVAQLTRLAIEKRPFERLTEVLELELGHDVAFAVERGKIAANASVESLGRVDLDPIEPGLSAQIGPDDLAQTLAPAAEKIQTCARETLAMADTQGDRVDRVIFVGGSSLMAVVELAMVGLFPKAKLEYGDAFTAIIDGLVLSSGDADGKAS